MTRILAIDPGVSGGIAYHDGEATKLYPMPDTDGDKRDLLTTLTLTGSPGKLFAYMEKVGGYIAGARMPGSRMFNFGEGYGFLKGVLMTQCIPLELVTPQKWQKDLSIGEKDKAERKRRLKEKAQQLYPQVDGVTLKTCDALLILHYALQQH